jgi:hypothetical protein
VADRSSDAPTRSTSGRTASGTWVNALIGAGLRIEFLHEFPYSVHDCEPFFRESASGRFEVRDHPGMIPLMFSIRAAH